MTTIQTHYFSIEELCYVAELPSHSVIDIVEHGIVEPEGTEPENWVFSTHMVTVTQKAYRLHNDLGVNWAGIGLAIQLLDEMEQLKSHNQLLQRRLNRFIVD